MPPPRWRNYKDSLKRNHTPGMNFLAFWQARQAKGADATARRLREQTKRAPELIRGSRQGVMWGGCPRPALEGSKNKTARMPFRPPPRKLRNRERFFQTVPPFSVRAARLRALGFPLLPNPSSPQVTPRGRRTYSSSSSSSSLTALNACITPISSQESAPASELAMAMRPWGWRPSMWGPSSMLMPLSCRVK